MFVWTSLPATVNLLCKEVEHRDSSPKARTLVYLSYSTFFHYLSHPFALSLQRRQEVSGWRT
jgi:hypothetical protein